MIEKIKRYLDENTDGFEIFYEESDCLNIEIDKDKISFGAHGKTEGIGIRVICGNRIGFSYTNDVSKARECSEIAIKIARLSMPDKDFKHFVFAKSFRPVKESTKEVLGLTIEDAHAFANMYVSSAKEVNKDILASAGGFLKEIKTTRIVNSEGVDAEKKSAINAFWSELTLKHDDEIESHEAGHGSKRLLSADIGKEDAKELMALVGRKEVKTGEMRLLLAPKALAELMDRIFAYSINAENIQQKRSFFCNKLGEQVFDEKVSIVDDAITPELFCTQSFDDEGTPSQRNNIIKKGVLKGFLYDSYTALKEGRKSTGNAARGIATVPYIVPNNVLMKPGKKESLIEEINKGVYVKSLLGCHTVNSTTGNFSLGILEGFYIENGEVKYPLKNAMISGNFFELMKGIVEIGKKVEHAFVGVGGYYLPSVLFEKVKVIGKG